MPRRVTFHSDGIQLVGYVYEPSRLEPGEARSGILLCHGFGAQQERFHPDVARHLSQQGYVVMTFDYRGFGESEGPRWRMIPMEQVADIRNALTFLQLQQEVQPSSVGLYGTSFGGANVCYTAAVDRRVKAVASVAGVGCGERWLRSLRRNWEWLAFLQELEEDWRQRVVTGSSRMVERTYIALFDPNTEALAKSLNQQFPGCTHMPLEAAQAIIDYHPEALVHQVSPTPILFVVAGRDALVSNDVTREMFNRAGEPKRWAVIPGIGHADLYSPSAFQAVMAEVTAWYERYLPAQPKIHCGAAPSAEAAGRYRAVD